MSRRRFAFGVMTAAALLIRLVVAHGTLQNLLPIVADVADAWLIWAIVARFAPAAAFGAAAFLLFNPAAIVASASFGQLDSVWWGAVLAAALAALTLHPPSQPRARLAWVAAGFAVPLAVFAAGAGAYPYTSVNAFNLYAARAHLWQPDTVALGVAAFTTARVGAVLFAGSLFLIAARYLERKDDRALLEGALLASLAFFLFLTRMHESGIYGALALSIPLIAFGGRYVVAACVLSPTALLNYAYAAAYASAMAHPARGVDPTDLWPLVAHPAAVANLAVFFALGYAYLTAASGDADMVRAFFARAWFRARDWFVPGEGLVAMTRRDALFAGAFAAAAFGVCVLWLQYPSEKIFDEVYYPRAGEEYLRHVDLGGHGTFEFTHPPFTKLVITLSMLVFGGLHGLGDTALGWRFLNVVVGALMLPLAYAFTKRLTGSTLAAAIAATLLLFDGFRFVQARIATPEITVALLALAALYAFYRVWTESETRQHVVRDGAAYRRAFAATLGGGGAIAFAAAWVLPSIGPRYVGTEWIAPTRAVVFLYVVAAAYLVAWLVAERTTPAAVTASYPDGTRVQMRREGASFVLPDGAQVAGGTPAALRRGAEWTRRFRRDGSEEYATPAGTAQYNGDATIELDGVPQPRSSRVLWVVLLGLACAGLTASKWNGILDVVVALGLAGFVVLQRYRKRPALYGNPFGFRLDVLTAWIVAVSGAIYVLCYIPYFALGHNLVDLVEMQHAMYQYHHDLVATHPYASAWWQWPLLLKPISYYYAAFEPYKTSLVGSECCVAEILAVPNPLVWWTGLISVPFVGFLAWKERSRGFLLLAVAYVMQWLPWALSPRIAFAYHFFPNLAVIVICDAILLHRIWLLKVAEAHRLWTKTAVMVYVLAAIAIFAFFYPVLAGMHIPYDAWRARMWIYPQWV